MFYGPQCIVCIVSVELGCYRLLPLRLQAYTGKLQVRYRLPCLTCIGCIGVTNDSVALIHGPTCHSIVYGEGGIMNLALHVRKYRQYKKRRSHIIIILINLFFTIKQHCIIHIEKNSERLPEKPQGSMNWPPITVLNVTNNNAKK